MMKNELVIKAKLIRALNDMGVTSISESDIEVLKTTNEAHGDLASNIAMKLARVLHKSPLEIASEIHAHIDMDGLEKVEVKAPGFINFFFAKDEFASAVKNILNDELNYGCSKSKNTSILLEFVSVNPTGDMHLGHARGAAIGDSLARILTCAGYDVKKEYYVNDGGSQVLHLGESIKSRYFALFGKEIPMPEDGYHGPDIIDIAKTIKDEVGNKYLNDDEETLHFFMERGVELELLKIKKDLKLFRVEFDIFTSEKKIRASGLVEEVISKLKPYTYVQDGALLLKTSEVYDEKDRVIIKSNGEYTYLLPDIAYHVDKFNRGYDKLIDLFGADHHGYINRMKSALRLLGYDDSRLDIELTQMVRILRGDKEVKLSKREGTADTLRSLVEEVGVDACRYFFVSRAPSTHLDLNLDLMMTKNNTNPLYYASYAHARLCSVLNQAENIDYLNATYSFADEAAISLIKKLMEFNDVVEEAAKSLAPHKVCAYVQKLAQLIHVFYTECRIINKDDMENSKSRLALCKASKIVLRKALELIGVNAPEKM